MKMRFDGPLTLNATGVTVTGATQAVDNCPRNATVKIKFTDLDQLIEWVQSAQTTQQVANQLAQAKPGQSQTSARDDYSNRLPSRRRPELGTGSTAPKSDTAESDGLIDPVSPETNRLERVRRLAQSLPVSQ